MNGQNGQSGANGPLFKSPQELDAEAIERARAFEVEAGKRQREWERLGAQAARQGSWWQTAWARAAEEQVAQVEADRQRLGLSPSAAPDQTAVRHAPSTTPSTPVSAAQVRAQEVQAAVARRQRWETWRWNDKDAHPHFREPEFDGAPPAWFV